MSKYPNRCQRRSADTEAAAAAVVVEAVQVLVMVAVVLESLAVMGMHYPTLQRSPLLVHLPGASSRSRRRHCRRAQGKAPLAMCLPCTCWVPQRPGRV